MPTALNLKRWWQRAGREDRAAPGGTATRDPALRRAAFEDEARRNEGALLRAARRLTSGDEDRAQDLVQEALVKGYEAYVAGRFAGSDGARAWLLRIMTNGFINEYRREAKWASDRDLDDPGVECALVGRQSDRPDAALLAATLDEPLERALASLSPEARACVVLVDIEGLEYSEAAQALSLPIGTVRSRLSRARLRLHAQLYDYARERRRV